MHVLKTGKCASLSGKSTLTYHIAHKEKEVYFCLAENTKSGVLSKEWISVQQMEALLAAEECTFTSRTSVLHTLYKGHSINSGGFLLAVLLKEGLVCNAEGMRRKYRRGDLSTFNAAIQELIESKPPKKERP